MESSQFARLKLECYELARDQLMTNYYAQCENPTTAIPQLPTTEQILALADTLAKFAMR